MITDCIVSQHGETKDDIQNSHQRCSNTAIIFLVASIVPATYVCQSMILGSRLMLCQLSV